MSLVLETSTWVGCFNRKRQTRMKMIGPSFKLQNWLCVCCALMLLFIKMAKLKVEYSAQTTFRLSPVRHRASQIWYFVSYSCNFTISMFKKLMVPITQGARKLMGENLKVIWAEFSTLSQANMLCMRLHGISKHALPQNLKLGPGFVLLA